MYDIIIIGCGPAGMTAAIYASTARKKILILEKETYGGQITKANIIKNYPGFEEISGYEFATKLYNQVKNNDVDIKFEEVIKIINNKDNKEIITRNNSYKCKCVIIATGADNRKLNLLNEDKFIGKGISYCATCDGAFYKDKVVAVYGGGNSAIEDSLYLNNIVNKIYLIYRNKEFKIDSINLNKLKEKENVEFILDTSIEEIKGNQKLESIVLKNNSINKLNEVKVDGLFIDIGHIPVSNMCDDLINIDINKYIIANEECTTNIEGIYVAGDVRTKKVRQLTTACSDGTNAAINAIKYINKKSH